MNDLSLHQSSTRAEMDSRYHIVQPRRYASTEMVLDCFFGLSEMFALSCSKFRSIAVGLLPARNLSGLHQSSILFLKSQANSFRCFLVLVHTAHYTVLFPGTKRFAREVIDA